VIRQGAARRVPHVAGYHRAHACVRDRLRRRGHGRDRIPGGHAPAGVVPLAPPRACARDFCRGADARVRRSLHHRARCAASPPHAADAERRASVPEHGGELLEHDVGNDRRDGDRSAGAVRRLNRRRPLLQRSIADPQPIVRLDGGARPPHHCDRGRCRWCNERSALRHP
jgi:hypothetical protein